MSVTNTSCGYLTPAERDNIKTVAMACEASDPDSVSCNMPTEFNLSSGPSAGLKIWLWIVNDTGAALTDPVLDFSWGSVAVQPTGGGEIPAPLPIYEKLPAGTAPLPGDSKLYTGEVIRKVGQYPSFGCYGFLAAASGLYGTFGGISYKSTELGAAPGCTIGWASFMNVRYMNTDVDFKADAAAMSKKMDSASKKSHGYQGIGKINGMGLFSNVFGNPSPPQTHLLVAYIGPY